MTRPPTQLQRLDKEPDDAGESEKPHQGAQVVHVEQVGRVVGSAAHHEPDGQDRRDPQIAAGEVIHHNRCGEGREGLMGVRVPGDGARPPTAQLRLLGARLTIVEPLGVFGAGDE